MNQVKLVEKLKRERDFLLKQQYVSRTSEHALTEAMGSDIIKVISGPRRAGKSTMGMHVMAQNYPDFLYVNFDSLDVMQLEDKYGFLVEASKSFQDSSHLFLDEIQNVPSFELLVSQLQRNGFNIVMTGSNANLLSRELSTHLTGRFVEIEVLPFSFNEARGLIPEISFLEYLKLGGFPEQLKSAGAIDTYLETLFESIVLKDIVARHNVRNTLDLTNLSTYLASTPSQQSNFTRLKEKLRMASVNTVIDFFGYLQEAYLVYKLPNFSWKSSEVLKSDFKIYLIDTGLFTANSVKFNQNTGHLFENAIFLELVRQHFRPQTELFQLKNKDNTEVDFFVNADRKVLIQACLSLKDNATRSREFAGILSSEVKYDEALVVVLDPTEAAFSEGDIRVIGVEEWMNLNAN